MSRSHHCHCRLLGSTCFFIDFQDPVLRYGRRLPISTVVTYDRLFLAWSNVSQHAMNSCFALFEILLTNAGPSPWSHITPGLVLFACYLGVAYITHVTQGFYSKFIFT
jgi:hypothetical protein